MTQPMPTMIPPNAITSFGPIVSAIQPSIGVSHVSKSDEDRESDLDRAYASSHAPC